MRRSSAGILALTAAVAGILALSLARAGGQRAGATPVSIVRQDCYGFELSHVSVSHQGKNTLNISVLYRYPATLATADYPDVNLVRKDVLDGIATHPNTTDYWEVYTAKLADHIYHKFGREMEALRVKVDIAPGPGEPFHRTSLVTRSRPGAAAIIP